MKDDCLRSRLKAKITLEVPTEVRDALGGLSMTWATVAEPWAEVVHAEGDENLEGDQWLAEGQTRFGIRYSATVASVNAKCRVVFDGDNYEILDVRRVPATRSRELLIKAERRRD